MKDTTVRIDTSTDQPVRVDVLPGALGAREMEVHSKTGSALRLLLCRGIPPGQNLEFCFRHFPDEIVADGINGGRRTPLSLVAIDCLCFCPDDLGADPREPLSSHLSSHPSCLPPDSRGRRDSPGTTGTRVGLWGAKWRSIEGNPSASDSIHAFGCGGSLPCRHSSSRRSASQHVTSGKICHPTAPARGRPPWIQTRLPERTRLSPT